MFSAVVPSIWPLEVANALLMGVRRGRIAAEERDHLLQAFEQLDLEHDAETRLHAWGGINRLAGQHWLTVYDACYLELALRRRLPLATLDAALARAAQAEGLTTLP
jgi:predicted nucleic acid-binding protein